MVPGAQTQRIIYLEKLIDTSARRRNCGRGFRGRRGRVHAKYRNDLYGCGTRTDNSLKTDSAYGPRRRRRARDGPRGVDRKVSTVVIPRLRAVCIIIFCDEPDV